MGREIRRVPPDWEHPLDDRGHYIPLYDGDLVERERGWVEEWQLWQEGKHPDQLSAPDYYKKYRSYSQYEGRSPDPESYRERQWAPEEATAYQIYETVSEGTPVSPVFKTLDAMETWLIGQGHKPEDARAFVKHGYVPSMTFSTTQGMTSFGIEGAANVYPKDDES